MKKIVMILMILLLICPSTFGEDHLEVESIQFGEYYTLSVECINGSVKIDPDKDSYSSGEKVTIAVTPSSGYRFVKWESINQQSPRLVLTMNENIVLKTVCIKMQDVSQDSDDKGSSSDSRQSKKSEVKETIKSPVEKNKKIVEMVKSKEGREVELKVKDIEKDITAVKFDSEYAEIEIPTKVLSKFEKVKLVVKDDVILTKDQEVIVGDAKVYDFNLYSIEGDQKTGISVFEEPVKVTVPYTLKEGENPDLLTVFYLSDENDLTNVAGTYKDGFITFETSHFSKYFAKENKVTFEDTSNHSVMVLASKGIIVGKENGFFEPKSHLTRAEAATILVKAFKLAGGNDDKTMFLDVPNDHWAADYICIARDQGLVSGIGNNRFDPNASVKRQDSAVMVSNIIRDEQAGWDKTTSYDNTSAYANHSIFYLIEMKILDEAFKDGVEFISREEFCELVYKTIFE